MWIKEEKYERYNKNFFNSVDFNDLMGSTDVYYGYSPIFDADYYMNTYPDIYAACGGYDRGNAFVHFLICGMNEGRRGSEEFDVYSYKNQYYDLRAAFGDDLPRYYLHYAETGKAEESRSYGDAECSSRERSRFS